MKHVMIDTNVALDVLANRKPFAEEASQLFNLAAQGRVKLYLSSLSYTNLFYVLKKDNRTEVVLSSLRNLEHLCETVDVNAEVIKAALRIRSGDLEGRCSTASGHLSQKSNRHSHPRCKGFSPK